MSKEFPDRKINGAIEQYQFIHQEELVALKADGFDDALIGVGNQTGSVDCLVYDRQKCIKVLVDRDGMTYEEAVEFFEFNVACAYVGKGTPIFIEPITNLKELNDFLGI
tara:strand:- start:416 stop:742 length:327 start_codon:yes stop_codon:yes gene_type:complete